MNIFEGMSPYTLIQVNENFMMVLGIALGGAIGAYARYSITIFFVKREKVYFPFGTLCVNLLGSFLIGLALSFFFLYQVKLSGFFASFFVVGLLGALTTFSTFAYDSFFLWTNGERLKAVISVFMNIFGGFVLAFIGFLLPLL